ncbi:hypothetical protein [Fructobacillus ficulneus]|uniref:hypothetical protein n=1 Tax=Fructobacillus ficulneus TaxID=157463 RepID=UPI0007824CC6|nr:hypothetical protein [Fructobacillus ficulneus]
MLHLREMCKMKPFWIFIALLAMLVIGTNTGFADSFSNSQSVTSTEPTNNHQTNQDSAPVLPNSGPETTSTTDSKSSLVLPNSGPSETKSSNSKSDTALPQTAQTERSVLTLANRMLPSLLPQTTKAALTGLLTTLAVAMTVGLAATLLLLKR